MDLRLLKLIEWSEEWQMLFSIEKCKVMHFGFNNAKEKYEMDGKESVDVGEEKELGL